MLETSPLKWGPQTNKSPSLHKECSNKRPSIATLPQVSSHNSHKTESERALSCVLPSALPIKHTNLPKHMMFSQKRRRQATQHHDL